MKSLIISLSIILAFSCCYGQKLCSDLPDKFSSYSEAIKQIEAAHFQLTDALPDYKSSWIASAKWYSCDARVGYLIYTTDKGRSYIHEKVPIVIWSNFKMAISSGSYYVQNIKGEYRLIPD